jgi:hypothetical protein
VTDMRYDQPFAAFDMASASAIARRYRRRAHQEFLWFPRLISQTAVRPAPLFREAGRPATAGGQIGLAKRAVSPGRGPVPQSEVAPPGWLEPSDQHVRCCRLSGGCPPGGAGAGRQREFGAVGACEA